VFVFNGARPTGATGLSATEFYLQPGLFFSNVLKCCRNDSYSNAQPERKPKMSSNSKSGVINICFILLLTYIPGAMAITIDELADICRTMESAISDIRVEYEWYLIPPSTPQEMQQHEAEMGLGLLRTKDGVTKHKLSASGLLPKRDPNDPNAPLPERFMVAASETVVDAQGHTWDSTITESYNGQTGKRFQDDGWPARMLEGIVSQKKRFDCSMLLSPVGFSILRPAYCPVMDYAPLSVVLTRHKEFVRLDSTIRNVNGFNAIRIDVLTEYSGEVFEQIYFSVDHGYTPVCFKYINGYGTPQENSLNIDVGSLEEVADGLWFPSSGTASCTDEGKINVYEATGPIVVNQGLKSEDFDIKFPLGTKVYDHIDNTKYVVKEAP